jgi:hypothetical protein
MATTLSSVEIWRIREDLDQGAVMDYGSVLSGGCVE